MSIDAQEDFEQLLSNYSDTYKDTFGMRPRRNLAMEFSSAEEVQEAIDGLLQMQEDYAEMEADDAARAADEAAEAAMYQYTGVDDLEHLPKTMGMGRRDVTLEAFVKETLAK